MKKGHVVSRIRTFLMGGARSVSDPSIFHKLSLIAFFAWVGLGADGISSSCYGPEEAFLALGRHHFLGVFVALAAIGTIFIISASYHHIIELFPAGGGGYLVASKLLSPSMGMVSGCALLIDYLLTITLSVASGADALFSFLPASWYSYRLEVAVLGVILLIWLNLRGVKESVMPLVPIFLIFIATHIFLIVYALIVHSPEIPALAASVGGEVRAAGGEMGMLGVFLLVMRAYSMGAGTFTGIEAVSNGIPILRDPKVATAKRTMNYMAISLSVMVGGLMVAYLLYGVNHVPGKTLNAVLLETVTRDWTRWGMAFVLVTLVSEATLLFVAAQTGFLDGPRVLSNMALDRWMPGRFALLNDRLVTKNGILIMGIASIILMLYSRGSVKFLVVLYSINVFITFSLSQLGMVRHWWQARIKGSGWKRKLAINFIGLALTSTILVSVSIIKFHEGGWLTIIITGSLVILSIAIRRHYRQTGKMLGRLSGLVDVANMDMERIAREEPERTVGGGDIDTNAKTAVLFVNGFSGMGLHTLFSIIRLFSGVYRNFVFVQVGLVDSGVFKGAKEIEELKDHIRNDAQKYADYMRAHGHYAETVTSIAVDIVEESMKLASDIREKYPQSTFFAGQLVFREDTFFTRLLHNYTAFAIQRRFYHMAIPVVILPIRV